MPHGPDTKRLRITVVEFGAIVLAVDIVPDLA